MQASKKQTLNEYLGERGLSSPMSDFMIDKLRIPHGQTERQRKAMQKEADRAADEYQEKRSTAIREYGEKVASGEIIAKSKIEQLVETANGHPDNLSVQAARRCLIKRGITEW